MKVRWAKVMPILYKIWAHFTTMHLSRQTLSDRFIFKLTCPLDKHGNWKLGGLAKVKAILQHFTSFYQIQVFKRIYLLRYVSWLPLSKNHERKKKVDFVLHFSRLLIGGIIIFLWEPFIKEGNLEAKTECYGKDKLKSPPFLQSFYNHF